MLHFVLHDSEGMISEVQTDISLPKGMVLCRFSIGTGLFMEICSFLHESRLFHGNTGSFYEFVHRIMLFRGQNQF